MPGTVPPVPFAPFSAMAFTLCEAAVPAPGPSSRELRAHWHLQPTSPPGLRSSRDGGQAPSKAPPALQGPAAAAPRPPWPTPFWRTNAVATALSPLLTPRPKMVPRGDMGHVCHHHCPTAEWFGLCVPPSAACDPPAPRLPAEPGAPRHWGEPWDTGGDKEPPGATDHPRDRASCQPVSPPASQGNSPALGRATPQIQPYSPLYELVSSLLIKLSDSGEQR